MRGPERTEEREEKSGVRKIEVKRDTHMHAVVVVVVVLDEVVVVLLLVLVLVLLPVLLQCVT